MSAANVIDFPVSASGSLAQERNDSPDRVTFNLVQREGVGDVRLQFGTKELYPSLSSEDSYAGVALQLLDKILDHLKQAEVPNMSYIDTDTALMKVKIELLRAFEYRDALGQGYAGVINAAIWGLANASVEPFSRRQIRTLSEVLHRLRNGPYMRFDTAMTLMDELESEGIDIEPSVLDDLLVEDNA